MKHMPLCTLSFCLKFDINAILIHVYICVYFMRMFYDICMTD